MEVTKMTKKEICTINKSFAYYSGLNGVELHHIEYGINDYVYCTSGSWYGHTHYHKVKIQFDKGGNEYIRIHGYKIPLDECIRI